jgi:alpha-tubulin suppressor-like RCC1 family protein
MPPAVVPLGSAIVGAVIAVATGDHTCVLTDAAGDNLHCWGRNSAGQAGHDRGLDDKLGDAAGEVPSPPVALDRRAVAVVAGYLHTCAVLDDDSLRCWGANAYGQLGYPDVGPDGLDGPAGRGPVLAAGSRQVAAGCYHTCALQTDDAVRCWGLNADGQLGTGDHVDVVDPAAAPAVALDPPAESLAAGCYHTCAVLTDGSARCWGRNVHGQLGAGDAAPIAAPGDAAAIDLGRPIVAVTAGHSHTCALRDDGGALCWGANDHGQLGLGDTDHRFAPPAAPIDLGEPVREVTAARFHTCARTAGGRVRCWGINAAGELGLGHTSDVGDEPGELPPPPLRLYPAPAGP